VYSVVCIQVRLILVPELVAMATQWSCRCRMFCIYVLIHALFGLTHMHLSLYIFFFVVCRCLDSSGVMVAIYLFIYLFPIIHIYNTSRVY
jgi:hypothetical protein